MIRRREGQGEESEDRDSKGKVENTRGMMEIMADAPPYNGFRDFSELVGGNYFI